MLGVDNRTRAASGSAAAGNGVGRALTSDQEQWAAFQSAADIEAELAAAGSPFRLKLDTLFAGDDADSDAAKVAIASFAANCSANGAGAFVGGCALRSPSVHAVLPTPLHAPGPGVTPGCPASRPIRRVRLLPRNRARGCASPIMIMRQHHHDHACTDG